MSKHMVREHGVGHPNTFVNGAMQGAEASRQEPTPSISAVLTEYRLSPSLPNQRFVSEHVVRAFGLHEQASDSHCPSRCTP